jgi:hypothetical protein
VRLCKNLNQLAVLASAETVIKLGRRQYTLQLLIDTSLLPGANIIINLKIETVGFTFECEWVVWISP